MMRPGVCRVVTAVVALRAERYAACVQPVAQWPCLLSCDTGSCRVPPPRCCVKHPSHTTQDRHGMRGASATFYGLPLAWFEFRFLWKVPVCSHLGVLGCQAGSHRRGSHYCGGTTLLVGVEGLRFCFMPCSKAHWVWPECVCAFFDSVAAAIAGKLHSHVRPAFVRFLTNSEQRRVDDCPKSSSTPQAMGTVA